MVYTAQGGLHPCFVVLTIGWPTAHGRAATIDGGNMHTRGQWLLGATAAISLLVLYLAMEAALDRYQVPANAVADATFTR